MNSILKDSTATETESPASLALMALDRLVSFARNAEPRCPVALVLDVSQSMRGTPIQALNNGIDRLLDELKNDKLARLRVDLSVIAFSTTAKLLRDFATIDESDDFPELVAQGRTAMGAGIVSALNALEARKAALKQHAIQYYRPWMIMISDGGPTDAIAEPRRLLKASEASNGLAFFPIGVEGADFALLSSLGHRPAMQLNGLDFSSFFLWLSASLKQVSRSTIGDAVELPPADGWGCVRTAN